MSYYSKENSSQEVDFVVQREDHIYALEVKAEMNLQSKSLKSFHAEHADVKCVRTSMADFKEQDWMTNVPLFALINYLT